MRRNLKSKSKKTLEYLGCDIETYREYLEKQFDDGMTWENYGEWEIDHIIPVKYDNPDFEVVAERLHYTNTQPMWRDENMSKGNKHILGVIYKDHDMFPDFKNII